MLNLKNHLKILFEDKSTGETICGCGCGRVVDSKKPDLAAKKLSESDSRSNPISSLTVHDRNLTTRIGNVSGDPRFKRLEKVQNWVRVSNSREARLFRLIELILEVADKCNLSKAVAEDACYLARKIQRGNRKKGLTQKTLACILLFLASKRSFTPKSIATFSEFLTKKKGLAFLGIALDLKDELKINYEVKAKTKKKPKSRQIQTQKPTPLKCEFCDEPTTRKPLIFNDGIRQICCNFCEQRLRTRGIEFHREGTKKESELVTWHKTGIMITKDDFEEFDKCQKEYMEENKIAKLSRSKFIRILLKKYKEAQN